jgi:hypothetical protein
MRHRTFAVVAVANTVVALLVIVGAVAWLRSRPLHPADRDAPAAAPHVAAAVPVIPPASIADEWRTFRAATLDPVAIVHNDEELDFNGDGTAEHLVFMTDRALVPLYGGLHEKERIDVYRWDGTTFVADHRDEATQGMYAFESYAMAVEPIDVEGDGTPEVIITKQVDGTGMYTKRYILKWDGTRVADLFFPSEQTIRERASKLLEPDEVLGMVFVGFPYGRARICPNDPGDYSNCTTHLRSLGEIGSIMFTIQYSKGRLVATSFRRETDFGD